jgi:hypothetical protein
VWVHSFWYPLSFGSQLQHHIFCVIVYSWSDAQKIWCYKWLPKLSGIRNCWLPPIWSNSSCGAIREDIGRGSLATTCRSANVARAAYQGKAYAPKPLAEHISTVLDTSSAADICISSKLLTRLVHRMFPKLCWTPIVTKVYESMSVAALPTIRMMNSIILHGQCSIWNEQSFS